MAAPGNISNHSDPLPPHQRRAPAERAQVDEAIASTIQYLTDVQHEEGHVVGEVVWNVQLASQYVIACRLMDREIPALRKRRLRRYLENHQNGDGGWGIHFEGHSFVFVTSLAYVALRILGEEVDSPLCVRARHWLHANGGVLHVPSWGKVWLSMIGLYNWDGVAPILPELWLQPDASPFHPRRMYCHTRLIYLGIGYLFGVRFTGPVDDLVLQLRRELYNQPFDEIDFSKHRYDLAPADTWEKPHPVLKAVYELCGLYDRWHPAWLRQRALDDALDRIVMHQRESNYFAISPVNGLLNTLALHHAGHPDEQASFEGLDYWVWSDEEEGERLAGATSHTWDTAFAAQAICEGPAAKLGDDFLQNAARYFTSAQVTTDYPNAGRYYRDKRRGGWCFGDPGHQWPVSDTTAEALSALTHLADHVDTTLLPDPDLLAEAVRFVALRQNEDGGFGSYEARRGGYFLEMFNPSEMFANCMVEASYTECTASCMQAIRHATERWPSLFTDDQLEEYEQVIQRGARLLRAKQLEDGSWTGFWGINYTYGTLFGVIGLLVSGAPAFDPAIERACRWLIRHQHRNGGWGESYESYVEGRYIEHHEPQAVQTAWALMTLLKAGYTGPGVDDAIERGVELLLEKQLKNGNWPLESGPGIFFDSAVLDYDLYRTYFPLWALGLYRALRG